MATKKRKTTTKKGTTTKKRTTKKTTNEVLVVQSKFKEALKAHGVNVSADAIEGMNAVMHWYIDQAATRAAQNGRKTVRAHDFVAN